MQSRAATVRENSLEEWFSLRIADWRAWEQLCSEHPKRVTEEQRWPAAGVVAIRTTRAFLFQQLLPQPWVLFADVSAGADVRPDTDVPGHNLALNRIAWSHARHPSVDGRGRVLSIKENRFDTTDIDLRGRVLLSTLAPSPFQENHATTMATLAAGAGNGTLAGRGAAPGARLTSAPYGMLFPETDIVYTSGGISVQNHSYGSALGNYYGNEARAFDQSVRLVPHLVHVFSAGNTGEERATDGRYRGLGNWATLSGNFKMAKNVLTVGAVNDAGVILPISARGPAYDGRLKPDLCAAGNGGTSESAALTSGTAALVQQVYAQQHGDTLPPAAWVRALLTGTALDRGVPGPDYVYGFGLLNAEGAVRLAQRAQYHVGHLQGTSSRTYTLVVPPRTEHLRVTLAWDDVAAEPTTTRRALVHDLDMWVTDANGRVWQPLVNSHLARADSLTGVARPQRDTLNTLEQVVVARPQPGVYTVTIRADLPTQARQTFAYVWDTPAADVCEWVQPTGSHEVGEPLNLYWHNTYAAQPAYVTWQPLGQPAEILGVVENARDGHLRWEKTPTQPTRGFFTLVQGARAFSSDTVWFVRAPRVQVGYLCGDSAYLSWRPTLPQARYQIQRLGARYLEPFLTTRDTATAVSLRSGSVFAVLPLLPTGEAGVRSAGTNLRTQGVGCYWRNFLVQRSPDGTQALGRLSLGTVAGLRRVTLEKERNGAYTLLRALPLAAGPLWAFADGDLHPGLNRYRARLELANGQILYSDPQDILATGEQKYWVYPNPVTRGQFNVLWEQPVIGVLYVHDATGKLCLQANLATGLNQWEVTWPIGVYVYQIHFKGQRVTGKVMVVE